MKHILDDSRSSHFWSTFWSPNDACYIPFQSSGSQQSNASNGARFGVETKKLQPLQVNHSKVLRNQPFVARISQHFCTVRCFSFWRCTNHAARRELGTSRWKPTSQPCEDSLVLRNNFADTIFLLRNDSWSLPKFATDIGRYFPLDFCCLNPKILLVNHQLHDSLVFKLVKRPNIFVRISFILVWYKYLSGACSRERSSFCKSLVSK